MVHVARAQGARQFLQQVKFFQGGRGRRQGPQALHAALGNKFAYRRGGKFQRRGPVGDAQFAVHAYHGGGQTVFTVESFIAKAVAVRQPHLVDVLVFARQHAHDGRAAHLQGEVGADAIVWAYPRVILQFPGARGITERPRGERAHGTQVYHVAGEFGVHGVLDIGAYTHVLAAAGGAQLHDAGDLLTETHAAGAVYAARHVGGDERPDILIHDDALVLLETRHVAAVTHRQVLQLAFAALIADRAVQWMIDEQKLHHALLCIHRLGRARVHLHAFAHRRGAGRQGLADLLHFHQAHAAIGGDR